MLHFYESLRSLSEITQEHCRTLVHSPSHYSFVSEAFLCGVSSAESSFFNDLQNLGIIHLIVVSGAHLLMLSNFLDFFLSSILKERKALQRGMIFSFLTLYVLMTGLQAPTVRAFAGILIKDLSNTFKLSTHPSLITLLSGLLCLFLFPDWISSISFILSWLASIGLSWSLPGEQVSLKLRVLRHALTTIVIQILLLPLMSGWSGLSFIGNFLLTPILSILLWPLCFLTSLSQFLPRWSLTFTDKLWVSLNEFLSQMIHLTSFEAAHLQIDLKTAALWTFLLLVQFLQIYLSINFYRGRHA